MPANAPLANDSQTEIRDITARIQSTMEEVSRDIHAHPELAL